VLPAGFSAATPSFIGRSARFILSRSATPAPGGARNLCSSHSWACATSGNRAPLTRAQLQTVAATNRRINRTVRQITDRAQYGVEDYWALPTARGGDCEDFAMLKKLELMRAGIAPERLLIATVLDRRLVPHAVLVLRTDFGDFVLDNLTSRSSPGRRPATPS
jgi:predicted transglutaminase-like cysteine proteinase